MCANPLCPKKQVPPGHVFLISHEGSSEHGKKFCSMECTEEYVKTIPGKWHACSDYFVALDRPQRRWWHRFYPPAIVHYVEIEKKRDKKPREVREARNGDLVS